MTQAAPGSYLLLFALDDEYEIHVGGLGSVQLQPGYHAYIGSALGPGGIRARVGRHLRPISNQHWHIDYLSSVLRASQVFFCYCQRRLEHLWAAALIGIKGASTSVVGFGASDCSCQSHLVFFTNPPKRGQLIETLGGVTSSEVPILHLWID